MTHFSLKNHFTWMIIAGAVIAANGLIQLAGGNQPLGIASLAVGVLLVGLGFGRPRAMSGRGVAAHPTEGESGARRKARLIRPIGFLLVAAAFLIALFAGLPDYYRNQAV